MVRALVVDDDRAVRAALTVNLEKAGIHVDVAGSAEEALDWLASNTVDVVLTDVRMPGMGGLSLLAAIRSRWPHTEVVVMTGYGNVEDAVSAMKGGAADYIIKPVSKSELLIILERALAARALRDEVQVLRREVKARWGLENLIGDAPPMRRVYEQVRSVAETGALVLLKGETGTGKELIARAIHQLSPRRNAPFLRVNCAALPDTLLESELFGHDRGAFTGAIRTHQGKFEQAHGGTILLDEIGDVSAATQAKLLHVLERAEFQRLGGQETIKVDVRVVAATNADLLQRVQEGTFRKDLFYRLHVFAIRLPPLRERKEDIPSLVRHFLRRFQERSNRPVTGISPQVLQQLVRHDWPGNVRELEHVVERAVILATGPVIESVELEGAPLASPPVAAAPVPEEVTSLQEALESYERNIIEQALKAAGGVQAQAAKRLGISRSNLHYRIQRLSIAPKGDGS